MTLPRRRIIVCGGRKYSDSGRIYFALEPFAQDGVPTTVVHGACPGADLLAAEEARGLGLTVEAHPADWTRGLKAGPERNQRMVDAGADLVIAFDGGGGTADCVRKAERAGIPVRREP